MSSSNFQNKSGLFMIGLSLLFVILIACNLVPALGTPTPAARHQWIEKWLNTPSCQPPCWENIIPGETSLIEAASILSRSPNVKITLLPNKNNNQISQLQWQLESSSDTGIADSDETGDKIASLVLSLGSDQLLMIDEVISKYGQPSHVIIFDCRGEITQSSCIIHLVYPNLGMAIEILLRSQEKEGYHVEINSVAKVGKIMLFPKGENTYQQTIAQNLNKPQMDWRGFDEYP